MRERTWGMLLVSGLVLASCQARLTNRDVFADLTFPAGPPPPGPAPRPMFQAYALLQDVLGGPWASPHRVAACLSVITEEELTTLGTALATGASYEAWGEEAKRQMDQLRATHAPSCEVDAADITQLTWTLAKSALAVKGLAEVGTLDPAQRDEVYRQAIVAIRRHATLLAEVPDAGASLNFPVLALSGGAANGAFTAGFLYELFASREEALAEIADVSRRDAADRNSRFRAVVGTSVGAVLGQILELYHLDDAALDPARAAEMESCASPVPAPLAPPRRAGGPDCFSGWPDAGWPTVALPASADRPRRPQRCALSLMETAFSDGTEASFMCVEPGAVTRIAGPLGGPARPNFIRFDTLQTELFDRYLGPFAGEMTGNDLHRVVVTTEFQQSQAVGLDERACLGRTDVAGCLSSQLMASLVLPLFAAPVRHTFTGLAGNGECGVFFDGGLRSVLPALRALTLSRPVALLGGPGAGAPPLRVLAVGNGRLVPLPGERTATILDALLGGLSQFTNQVDTSEVGQAQQVVLSRETEMAVLLGRSPASIPPPVFQLGPPVPVRTPRERRGVAAFNRSALRSATVPVLASNPYIDAVYVPADVPPWIIFGAGYSFDRTVMRGLFMWGRHVAQERLRAPDKEQLARRLGWPTEVVTGMRQAAERHAEDPRFDAWFAQYRLDACTDFQVALNQDGRARVVDTVPACKEPPVDAPRDGGAGPTLSGPMAPTYFACPASALDLGER